MRLLLDTHALVWWLAGTTALSHRAKLAIDDSTNEKFVSAVSAWEIVAKYQLGKWPQVASLAADVLAQVRTEGFTPLSLAMLHAQAAGALPLLHKDPFDRMLVAQAQIDNLTLVSTERVFDAYGVTRLW